MSQRPNIIYILADDQGHGDATCYNPNCKAPTPRIDQLAREGCRFTDAHTSSAVCTPTRYSVLTGRYNWRSWMKRGVLAGHSPMLLEPDHPTVAAFLQQHGYRTACIGKWHLGLGWQTTDGEPFPREHITSFPLEPLERIDFRKPVTEGPNDFGFDESLIIPSSLDIPPYVYLENGSPTGVPSEQNMLGVDTPYLMRQGPAVPGMKAEDVLPTFKDRVVQFIDDHAQSDNDQPFFIYFPLTAPHTPIVPIAEYRGTTPIGLYGDFITQIDAVVGEVLDALQRNDLADDTLVIYTSDNGASPAVRLDELAAQGHEANWPWRGTKADLYEGGHRVPFVARWPNGIPAGQVCEQTICTTDLFATVAGILNQPLPESAGEDSADLSPVWRGEHDADGDAPPLREAIVHHSVSGHFAIRRGKWKLLEARGSGGWSFPKEHVAAEANLPEHQLYDLEQDPREQANLIHRHPDVAEELRALLDRYRNEARSVPAGAAS
ncbi:MAG: sulfatase family protein [Phycisphaeraceae bacterium]